MADPRFLIADLRTQMLAQQVKLDRIEAKLDLLLGGEPQTLDLVESLSEMGETAPLPPIKVKKTK